MTVHDVRIDLGAAAPTRPALRRNGRRRRPSGAAPPLPRHLGRTGRGWLIALALLTTWLLVAMVSDGARRLTDQVDAAILRAITTLRADWATAAARHIDRVATGWWMFAVAMVLLVATAACRRWRHLFTYLGSVIALQVVGLTLIGTFERARPYDVTIVGRWRGFSLPSATVAVVSFTVVGVIYMLVVPGRPRRIAKLVGLVVITAVVASRLLLGVDHPFDALVGVAFGVAIPLNAFRFFTPTEVVPVTYRAGKTAHLDLGGGRGDAIKRAAHDQLGLPVVTVAPVGLAGSGGSTPMRLTLEGEPAQHVFGKLYAMNHVRSDRWYKSGRTILYGRLEDEAPFQNVRRLVQYEDYMLRVMRDAGVATAAPLGIVELTPEREYVLVTEFFDGAVELGDAAVDDQIIVEGLALVRRLWDAGLAHRDIKPANLLVKDGHLVVVDVAFAQVRPSAWREAVDLANMMLVLAVQTDAERVYRRALEYFTPDEIAEAFAAARGIASPSQLRSVMKQDGRDLVQQFRSLAPARRPISLQRWGVRRVAMAVGLALLSLLAASTVYGMFTPAELPIGAHPMCGTDDVIVLMAQAVPSANAVPCLAALPAGWSVGGVKVTDSRARFWLDSDVAGDRAVEVDLLPPGECLVDRATEVATQRPGWERFDTNDGRSPTGFVRTYLSDGGCVVVDAAVTAPDVVTTAGALDTALSFQSRATLVADVERRSGLTLCGVGAPECDGGGR